MKKWVNEENNIPQYSIIVNRLRMKNVAWKFTSVTLFVVIIFLLLCFCFLITRPREGYVIEVMASSGEVYYNPDNIYAASSYEPDDLIKRQLISNFISNLRSVSTDKTVTTQWLLSVYAMIDKNAANQIKAYVAETDPVNRGRYERVIVDVFNISKLSDASWQVDWRETVSQSDTGTLVSDKRYRAILTTTIYKPRSQAQLESNPLGFYITDISISTIEEV